MCDNVQENFTYSFPIHPSLSPENIRKPFFDVFRGLRKGALGTNELRCWRETLLKTDLFHVACPGKLPKP